MVDIGEYSPVPESVPAQPDPSSISPAAWRRFETATLAVVSKIHPTFASEHLRAAVIDYVQRLFMFHTGYKVFRPPSLLQLFAVSVVYSLKVRDVCIDFSMV